jgi:hypothetical protein
MFLSEEQIIKKKEEEQQAEIKIANEKHYRDQALIKKCSESINYCKMMSTKQFLCNDCNMVTNGDLDRIKEYRHRLRTNDYDYACDVWNEIAPEVDHIKRRKEEYLEEGKYGICVLCKQNIAQMNAIFKCKQNQSWY